MGSNGNNLRRFGKYEIDLEKKILWVDHAPADLPVKAVELLCALVESGGNVVSKDELLEKVWNGSFVEEGVLPQNVYLLRKIFKGDELIQTVPRRGYRFVGELVENGSNGANGNTEIVIEREVVQQTYVSKSEYFDESHAEDSATPSVVFHKALRPVTKTNRRTVFIATAALAGVLIFAFGWMWSHSGSQVENTEPKLASIAVAPFVVIYDDPNSTAAARRGIAEALTFRLKQIRDIRVSELNEIEPYFSTETNPLLLAKNLGYESVLTGSVRKEDKTLNVSFELLSATDGVQQLADSFDLRPPFSNDDENAVALRLARKIDIKIAELRNAVRVPSGTLDGEAMQSYVLAQKIPEEFAFDRSGEAVDLMRKVVAAAPEWGMGHARLADALAQSASKEDCNEAKRSADRAIELDSSNAVAYMAHGRCAAMDFEWSQAEELYRTAIEHDPTLTRAYFELGQLLDLQRRFTEAEMFLNRAVELDPLSPLSNFARCQHYYFNSKWERSIADCEQALMLEPGYLLARKSLSWTYTMQGQWAKLFEHNYGKLSDEEIRRDPFARPLADGNIEQYWRVNLEWRKTTKRRQHSPTAVATYHSMLSEVPETLDLLEQAARERHYQIRFVYADPIWNSVRNEPRYLKLVQDIGLAKPLK